MDIGSLRIMQAFFMLLLHTSSLVVAANREFHGPSVMCKEKERQALLSLKHEFTYARDELFSWTSGENNTECCRWKGVGCNNRTGHVVKLDLHDLAIDGGIINPSLVELHHLTYLDLGMNSFNHIDIPKFIGSLTHLKYLSLSHAEFEGKIPHELGNLSHLEYLDLSGNFLTGEVPHNLGNLSHLQYLDLRSKDYYYYDYHRHLEDPSVTSIQSLRSDLEWVSHLKSLKTLDLGSVDLSSAYNWLEQVANLPYLQELKLRDSNLHDSIKSTFSSIKIISTNLSSVDLSSNNLTSSIHKSFLALCSLRELDLSFNKLSGRLDEFIPTSRNCAKYDLEVLDLSSNKFTGSVPNLSQFPSLRYVRFDFNRLNGSVNESVGELSKLETFSVGSNSLQGVITEVHFSKLSTLKELDLSHNALMVDVSSDWAPPFQIRFLYLASCKLGSHFPRWLQTQKVVSELDISSNSISDLIPDWFWDIFSTMQMLNLSYNQISGEIANLPLKEYNFIEVDLSFNLLQGQIPSFLSMASRLDLSNNKFLDANSFMCSNETKDLSFLDLSDNQLMSKLPECWRQLENLVFLSLANNNLYGNIPLSMGFLTHVEALHLGNNNFMGEIPLSLNNCSQLRTFDVVQNKLSGPIPSWIGDGLQKLQILSLRSNKFHGSLPFNLCHLSQLQLLDLAFNNIFGSIPTCLHKLTALVGQANSNKTITYYYDESTGHDSWFPISYSDSASFIWKGKEEKYRNTLGLVRSIDLSSNSLIGKIPSELMNLNRLVSLNISRNKLSGEILSTIGQLKSLDSLDLSRNQLSGKIPFQFSQLGFLGVLDLSYNNLSGEIPYVTKLLSFDASAYMGNLELCGAPLSKCSMNQTNYHVEGEKHNINSGFYVSMIIGFIMGFWGVCGSLVLKKSWRYAYFKFFDDLYNKLYVSSVISIAKQRRRMRNMSLHLNGSIIFSESCMPY